MVETPHSQEPVDDAKPPELSADDAAANAADMVATDKNSTADVKEPVTESDLTRAQTHLQPGEEILWTARCSPKEFKDQAMLALFIGVPIVLFMAIVFIGIIVMSLQVGGAFSIFVMIFVLFIGLLFVAMIWRIVPMLMQREKVGAKSIYVLSNRKLFISTTGASSPMQTWDLRKVENVSSKADPDGSGELHYLYGLGRWSNGGWYKYNREWLSGIPDVKSAEKQLTAAVERCIRETGDGKETYV